MINTCRGVFDSEGNLTLNWKDKVALKDINDGTSNTILAGELHIPLDSFNLAPMNGAIFSGQELESHTRVGGPGAPLLSDSTPAGQIFGFGSSHPGVTNFVFADGSNRSIKSSCDTVLLGRLCHRADGELLSDY